MCTAVNGMVKLSQLMPVASIRKYQHLSVYCCKSGEPVQWPGSQVFTDINQYRPIFVMCIGIGIHERDWRWFYHVYGECRVDELMSPISSEM